MARTPRDVTDTELAILEVLWERGPASRRQITDSLYPHGGPAQYATVQKLLDRLEAKEFVSRDRTESGLTFRATQDRQHLIGQRLREMAEKLCGGSLTPLIMNLVRARPLSGDELQELQQLLKQHSSENKRPDKR